MTNPNIARHWPLCVCLALVSLSPAMAQADDPDSPAMVSEEQYLQEIPVVLSATRLQQRVEDAPASVTIIDRDLIRASGAREIADLFRLVPGFQVGWEKGTAPVVTYHGMSDQYPRRFQVLVDGRSVYQPTTGGPSWTDLALAMDDIERIEVVRGPNSATYGSNAFMGAINIITRHASESYGTFLRATKGSHGINGAVTRYGGGRGDLDYRLTLSYQEDDGLTFTEGDPPYYKRVPLATLRTDYQATPMDLLTFQAGYLGGVRGDRESGVPFETHIRRHFSQLRWQHSVSMRQEFSVQVFSNYLRNDEQFNLRTGLPSPAPAWIPLDRRMQANRYGAEFQYNLAPTDWLRTVWGVSSQVDRVSSPFYFNQDDYFNIREQRLFGNLEVQVAPRLLVNAGGMVERNEFSGTDTSPRLALNFRLADGHTVRASASRAYRAPFAFEEHADTRITYNGLLVDQLFLSRGNLRSESIRAYELGYIGKLDALPLGLDMKLYQEDIDHIISPVDFDPMLMTVLGPDRSATGLQNLDSATIKGVETQLEYQFTPYTRLRLAHAYTKIDATDRGDYVYSRSAPRQSYSVMAIARTPEGVLASMTYYKVDEMLWLGIGDLMPRHERLDLRVGVPLKGANHKGEVAFVLQNLLDAYNEMRTKNIFDTRGYITFTLEHL